MKPFFAVYSSFLQRSIDQIIHDVAIANLNLTLCIDRAGFVGADGETHQGLYDIGLLTSIPNMTIYAPSNYNELKYMLRICSDNCCLQAIRYPRGAEPKEISSYVASGNDFDVIGNGEIAIITYGVEFANVLSAVGNNQNYTVIKLNKIFPINNYLYDIILKKKSVYIFEESSENGSIGEKIGHRLCELGFSGKFKTVAVSGFVASATVDSDFKKYSLDSDSIKNIVSE
jgi:1-deoxy-D-xylulose-5-phosphate synthase